MLEEGEHIGNYVIQRKLGEGGMGTVFEAVHATIHRRVAIKVLHPQFTEQQDIAQRFFNEARAVNIVDHPGVVQISEFERLADGTAYLVMEYLRGESLRARISRLGGPMAGREVVRLGRQIASTLAAAHEKGIIHRDLKPDNIMLVPNPDAPGSDRAKVLDFGIAKVATEYAGAAQMKTATGVLMGTPAYMAPEQCYGAAQADGQADVYALGIILYQLLTGQLPFQAESMAELIMLHVQGEPPPLRELDSTISAEMAALVHSLLAKAPRVRPSMAQVVAALDQMSGRRDGASAVPSATTLGAAASHMHARRPPSGRWWLAGPILAVAIGGGATLYWSGRPAASQAPAVIAAPAPVAVTPPQPPPTIWWSIATDPPGAAVIDLGTGALLGTTPWQSPRPRSSTPARLELRLNGHIPRQVILPQSENGTLSERLDPLPTIPVARPASVKSKNRKGLRDEEVELRD